MRPTPLGLLLTDVEADSPAEKASLLIGDLLLFESSADLSDAIAETEDRPLTIRFIRGDRKREREVVVRLYQKAREAA